MSPFIRGPETGKTRLSCKRKPRHLLVPAWGRAGGGTRKLLASHDWKYPFLIWVMVTRVPKYVKAHQAVYLRLVHFASSYIPSYFLKDFFWCGPFLKSLLNLLQFITCFKAWNFWPSQLPHQGSNSYPFCTGRWNFNHWNTRQVPYFFF